MSKNDLETLQANLILRRGLHNHDISLQNSSLRDQFLKVQKQKDFIRSSLKFFGLASIPLAIHAKYRRNLKWSKVIGRYLGLITMIGFAEWTSPASRRYNQLLLELSNEKKEELIAYVKSN